MTKIKTSSPQGVRSGAVTAPSGDARRPAGSFPQPCGLGAADGAVCRGGRRHPRMRAGSSMRGCRRKGPGGSRRRWVCRCPRGAALNAWLGRRPDVILVSPRTTLDFRPAATIESFADVAPLRYATCARSRTISGPPSGGGLARRRGRRGVPGAAAVVQAAALRRPRAGGRDPAPRERRRRVDVPRSARRPAPPSDDRRARERHDPAPRVRSARRRELAAAALRARAAGRRPRSGAWHRCRGRACYAGARAARGSRRRGERARRRPAR